MKKFIKKTGILSLAACSALCFDANASQWLDTLEDNLTTSDSFFDQYGTLLAFGTDPDISSAKFNLNDDYGSEIITYKLPMQKKLFAINNNNFYGRIGGNYFIASAEFDDEDNEIDAEWKGYGGSIGLLADSPIFKELSLKFAIDTGINRLENSATYQGGEVSTDESLFNGTLLNWSTNALLLSGTLGVEYSQSFQAIDIETQVQFTHTYISTFLESSDFSGFTANTNALNISSEITHPWNINFMGNPVYGVVHLGYTNLMQDNNDFLGFTYYGELGYSLKFDTKRTTSLISSFSLGSKVIAGENGMTGWSIILDYQI